MTMRWSLKAARVNDHRQLVLCLASTAALGAIFLAVQGIEWLRLFHFGSRFPAVCTVVCLHLIGFHGLHVVGALIWLLMVFVLSRERAILERSPRRLAETWAMYWTFVVALWPVLYGLVYSYYGIVVDRDRCLTIISARPIYEN